MHECWCFPQIHHGLHLCRQPVHKRPVPTLLREKDRSRETEPEPGFPSLRHKVCEPRSEDRMRQGTFHRGEELSTVGQVTAVGRSVSAQRARRSVCPQKGLQKLQYLPWHFLLLAMSHPCFPFQSGSQAQN